MEYNLSMVENLITTTDNKYPRGFANPYRCDRNRKYYIVNSINDLIRYINANNIVDCYMTVYSFNEYNQHIRDKATAVIDTIPFDFDDEENPQNAQNDVLKFIKWAETHNINARYHYSGNKGFHCLLDIEPIDLEYPQQTLKRFVKDMQEQAKFMTLDPVVPGDLDRVMRIPNTINSKTGLYCIPVPPDELKFLDTVDIEEMAKEESEYIPERKPLSTDSLVHGYLEHYDSVIAYEIQEAKEEQAKQTAIAKNSKFGDLLISDTTCAAYDEIMEHGAAKGERDYCVCGIVLRCKKHHMSENEIRNKLYEFNRKCTPPMDESYIENKLQYHLRSHYSPCTFFMNVSEACLKCTRK